MALLAYEPGLDIGTGQKLVLFNGSIPRYWALVKGPCTSTWQHMTLDNFQMI